MRFADIPEGSDFLDVDGIAVVRLPAGQCIAFATGDGAEPESRPYPNELKAWHDGDRLGRDEFAGWLKTGRNMFDVES
ncbi:hypothetical protein [Scleromatobacter humisilvae]|uniref:Uncharacterized protein n=1 Tax=Scleromatobacter humisilvae TaxID=2897159 RepID=A0A9X1YLZ0_9BURK|nr:hypothetical protein [Scleromatobacter humisilvae]MCK9687340.1 hypothetical protein [Scleromatobacter humisilvae]